MEAVTLYWLPESAKQGVHSEMARRSAVVDGFTIDEFSEWLRILGPSILIVKPVMVDGWYPSRVVSGETDTTDLAAVRQMSAALNLAARIAEELDAQALDLNSRVSPLWKRAIGAAELSTPRQTDEDLGD